MPIVLGPGAGGTVYPPVLYPGPPDGGGTLPMPALLHDLRAKPLSAFYANIDRTGAQDFSAPFNDCMQQYILDGDAVGVGAGSYRCESPLILQTYFSLIASPKADFRAHFSSAGGKYLFKTEVPENVLDPDPNNHEHDMSIEGGTYGVAGSMHEDGKHWVPAYSPFFCMGLFGDRITVKNVGFLGTGSNNSIIVAGEHTHIFNVWQRLPNITTSPFISFWGGKHNSLRKFDLTNTADTIAIGSPFNLSAFSDKDIEDIQVSDGTIDAGKGRILVIAVGTGPGYPVQGGLTMGMKDILAANITGYCGQIGITIVNTDSSGALDGLTLDNIVARNRVGDGIIAIDSGINMTSRLGGMKNFVFNNVRIPSPEGPALQSTGLINGFKISKCFFGKPAEADVTVYITGVLNGSMTDTTVVANNNTAILLGDETVLDTSGLEVLGPVKGFKLRDLELRDIANDKYALWILNGDAVDAYGITTKKADGATTAHAVLFDDNATNCAVMFSDFRETNAPTAILNQGIGNVAQNNRGVPDFVSEDQDDTITVDATTGVIPWVPTVRLVRLNVAGTITNITGVPAKTVMMTLFSTADSVTIQTNALIRLKPAVNAVLDSNDSITLQWDPPSAVWREIGRSFD